MIPEATQAQPQIEQQPIQEKPKFNKETVNAYIENAKKNKVPDQEIYNFLKTKGAFSDFERTATEAGISEDQQRQEIGKQLGIDTKKKPNMLQSSLELLAAPWSYLGEALGIQELKDVKALPGTFLANAIGSARSLIDAPAALIQAQFEHQHPEAKSAKSPIQNKFLEFDPSTGYVHAPQINEQGELDYGEIPETGDIGPFIRALLPSAGQTEQALVAESSAPESTVGKYLQRGVQFAGGGAIGGPVSIAAGAGLGLLDYQLEQQGVSPAVRALIEGASIGKTQGKGPYLPAPQPNEPQFLKWQRNMIKRSKSSTIAGVNDLAAKILIRDPENINFQAIADLEAAGFDLSNVPVQAYTKGGIPNWIEGAQENSLMGGRRYNKLMSDFTEGMTQRADQILDSIPIEEINDKVTHESLGEPLFENYVTKTLSDLAPNLEVDRPTIGSLGTEAIESFDTRMKSQADSLYSEANFTDVDFIEPNSVMYREFEEVVNKVEEFIEGEGFIGEDRKEALRVIGQIKGLFKEKKIGGTKTILGPNGEPFPGVETKPIIKLNDIRKNLQALNSKLSYDKPGIINLLEPISTKLREIFRNEAVNNPKVQSFVKAQEIFATRAKMLNDPLIRKFYNMSDEQFYTAMKKPTNLEAFQKFSEQSGDRASYDMLRGGILAKELQYVFEAKTPGEMAKKITDAKIETIRDLQRFYPEYPDLANGLKKAREGAIGFDTPEHLQRSKIRQEAIAYQMNAEAPSYILKTMDTPQGINIVKDTLSKTKQGKSIYNSMARKKLEQTIYKKTKQTSISLSDLSQLFRDEQSSAILKEILTEKNFNDMKILSNIAENFESGKSSATYMKKHFEKLLLGAGGATAMAALLGSGYMGAAGTLGLTTVSKMMLSPNFRKSVIQRARGIEKP